MIAVVADTGPLRYLVQIGCDEFLPILFTRVFIPVAVWRELQEEKTPGPVRRWAEHLPPWMEMRELGAEPQKVLSRLDAGEADAIQLAQELGVQILLIDERSGARLAREQGLVTVGTLGILLEAAQLGLIPIEESLERLAKTNFRRTSELFDRVREIARQRGIPQPMQRFRAAAALAGFSTHFPWRKPPFSRR